MLLMGLIAVYFRTGDPEHFLGRNFKA